MRRLKLNRFIVSSAALLVGIVPSAAAAAGPVAAGSTAAASITPAAVPASITPAAVPASITPAAVPASINQCREMTDSVVRLYSAYFLRAPDQQGFNYWADQFSVGAWNLERMSNFFAGSDEFAALYSSLDNTAFVNLIYQNVLGRPAEPSGLNFWVGQLNSGAMTRGRVMISFSESKEYVAVTGTAPPMAGYFSWYPEGTTWTCGTGSFAAPAAHRYLDVYGANRGGGTATLEAWLVNNAGGREENLLRRSLPGSSFAFFWSADLLSPAPPQPIAAIEIVAPSNVVTIVVTSPTPMPLDRADWSR